MYSAYISAALALVIGAAGSGHSVTPLSATSLPEPTRLANIRHSAAQGGVPHLQNLIVTAPGT